jgi:hypothetical protein
MNLNVGDIVRFRKAQGSNYSGTFWAQKDDLFQVVKIVYENRFISRVGIFIKSIRCPFCEHQEEIMKEATEKEQNGFDSGWFEEV